MGRYNRDGKMLDEAWLNATLNLGTIVDLDVAMKIVHVNVTWME